MDADEEAGRVEVSSECDGGCSVLEHVCRAAEGWEEMDYGHTSFRRQQLCDGGQKVKYGIDSTHLSYDIYAYIKSLTLWHMDTGSITHGVLVR